MSGMNTSPNNDTYDIGTFGGRGLVEEAGRDDPLASSQMHQNQYQGRGAEEMSSDESTSESEAEAEAEPVMGGMTGSAGDYMNTDGNGNVSVAQMMNAGQQQNLEGDEFDPGAIAQSHKNTAMQGRKRHITITADPIQEDGEEEKSRSTGFSFFFPKAAEHPSQGETQSDENAIAKSKKKSGLVASYAFTSKKYPRRDMDAQVKEQHQQYKRRYQNRPANRDSKHYATLNPPHGSRPALYKFIITKLRSWRTGYVRTLSLHETHFTTLDPDSHEITNAWTYKQIKNAHAIPNPQEEDCILIDVGDDKLKLKCCGVQGKNDALTAILECLYHWEEQERLAGRFSMAQHMQHQRSVKNAQQTVMFRDCQRLTRHRTTTPSIILCAPHGIVEMDAASNIPIRTYHYKCIRAVSFTSDDLNGVVFYISETNNNQFHQNQGQGQGQGSAGASASANNTNQEGGMRCEPKIYFIRSGLAGAGSGSGRSDLVSVLKNKFQVLCLPFVISESVTVESIVVGKLGRAHSSIVGEQMGAFRVNKLGGRASRSRRGYKKGDGTSVKYLVLTRNGFLVEMDNVESSYNANGSNEDGDVDNKIIAQARNLISSCRSLRDVIHIVRHSSNTINLHETDARMYDTSHPHYSYVDNSFTVEFKGGLRRTYACPERDAVIVSILDATVFMLRNFNATVTDVRSTGYRLHPYLTVGDGNVHGGGANGGGESVPATNIFHPEPIETQCLRKLHHIATITDSYVSHEYKCNMDIVAAAANTRVKESSGVPHTNVPNAAEFMIGMLNECLAVVEVCREFNANIGIRSVGKLPNDEKLVGGSVVALLGIISTMLDLITDANTVTPDHTDANALDTVVNEKQNGASVAGSNQARVQNVDAIQNAMCSILQTLYKLMMTPIGYTIMDGDEELTDIISSIWQVDDTLTLYWSLKCLSVLLLPRPLSARDRDTETMNKNILLGPQCNLTEILVGCMLGNIHKNVLSTMESASSMISSVSDLIQMVVSNIVESILCSHHDTTSAEQFSIFITALSKNCNSLMALLQSPTSVIAENAALILRILTTRSPKVAQLVKEASLTSGILLSHFYHATFSPSEGQRYLSRYLCKLWMSGPSVCPEKQLLKRMIPAGFIPYLSMPHLSPEEEKQLAEIERGDTKVGIGIDVSNVGDLGSGCGTNIERLRARMQITEEFSRGGSDETGGSRPVPSSNGQNDNFRIFFHTLTQDHSLPDLIWNQNTRKDLQVALEVELSSIKEEAVTKKGIENVAWNHQQFTVHYPSLKDEVRVGSVYLRLWLQASDSFIKTWNEPVRLFELLFRRLLCDIDRNANVANMCIRCLERLYSMHAVKIGAFPDISILLHYLGITRNAETRHRLLSLVATLLGVNDERDEVGKVPGNAEQLFNAEAIHHLYQLVAEGHLEPPSVKEESKVETLQSSPSVWYVAPPGKVPPTGNSIKGPFHVSDLKRQIIEGHLHRLFLVSAFHSHDYKSEEMPSAHDVVDGGIDTGKWAPLENVWQLRRQLLDEGLASTVFSHSGVSLLALQCLTRLVLAHKTVDSRGIPFFPIPIVKRLICENTLSAAISRESGAGDMSDFHNDALSIICQSFLTGHPPVVDVAAKLLRALMLHNEKSCNKLYLTGVFIFACGYDNSNWQSIAELLYETHLHQDFLHGSEAVAGKDGLSVKRRSILGNLLPEGLLKILVNHGAAKFAEVFVGDYDTPEVIWSVKMRNHLISMVHRHLGNFPKRLKEHISAKYEYCPIPAISYKVLDKELFCHNYYLNNLCDQQRFPDWEVREPIAVFRACIQKWKDLSSRSTQEQHVFEDDARKILGLSDYCSGCDLRKAYRILAKKYHPDRNPAGRDMFIKIQQAYEVLLPIVKDSCDDDKPQHLSHNSPTNMTSFTDQDVIGLDISRSKLYPTWLLMKAQLLIIKRYAEDVGKYKYPAYSMLLTCLQLPKEEQLFQSLGSMRRSMFIRTATDLIFHTCLVSPLNAEELILEGGVAVLDSILDAYVKSVSVSKKSDESLHEVHMESLVYVVHTFSGIAFYENGRNAIELLSDPERFCTNWRKCIDLQEIGSENVHGCNLLKRYALEGLTSMSRNAKLQNMIISSGVVWNLIRCMLDYDPNLELAALESEIFELGISQLEMNYYGGVAARALGMLSGVMRDDFATPPNQPMFDAMKRILTVPIARMLRSSDSEDILRTLNLKIETPMRLWDMDMRGELMLFITKMQEDSFENSTLSKQLEAVNTFQFTNLSNEVNIGGVYIRIFNRMDIKQAVREIPDCGDFALCLLKFIGRSVLNDKFGNETIDEGFVGSAESKRDNNSGNETDKEIESYPTTDYRFVMSVQALHLLVNTDGLIDDTVCESHVPGVLMSLLSIPAENEAFAIGIEILTKLSSKQSFADAFIKSGLLPHLCDVLEHPKSQENEARRSFQYKCWLILESFSSSQSVAFALVNSSGWLELLSLVAGYSPFTKDWASREGSAKTLARLLFDPSVSALTSSLLQCFIPGALVGILKDNGAQAMLLSFDKDSETPELIWNGSMRDQLLRVVTDLLDGIFNSETKYERRENFSLQPGYKVKYAQLNSELCIAGVYVRLFLKDPSFDLRDPNGFFESLLQRWSQELENCTVGLGDKVVFSHSREIVSGGHDVIDLVMNAVVCLCKLRHFLCEKLSSLGCLRSAVVFLHKTAAMKMTGVPMFSSIRLLHVSSREIANVDEIAAACDADGKQGVVDGMMNAIDGSPLHPDCGFMIETLKNIFETALGDLNDASLTHVAHKVPNVPYDNNRVGVYAMAPSPAPGTDPVSKLKKVDMDPLSMMGGPVPKTSTPKRISRAVRPNATGGSTPSVGQHYGMQQRQVPQRHQISQMHQQQNMTRQPQQQVLYRPGAAPRQPTQAMHTTHVQHGQNNIVRQDRPMVTDQTPSHQNQSIQRPPSLSGGQHARPQQNPTQNNNPLASHRSTTHQLHQPMYRPRNQRSLASKVQPANQPLGVPAMQQTNQMPPQPMMPKPVTTLQQPQTAMYGSQVPLNRTAQLNVHHLQQQPQPQHQQQQHQQQQHQQHVYATLPNLQPVNANPPQISYPPQFASHQRQNITTPVTTMSTTNRMPADVNSSPLSYQPSPTTYQPGITNYHSVGAAPNPTFNSKEPQMTPSIGPQASHLAPQGGSEGTHHKAINQMVASQEPSSLQDLPPFTMNAQGTIIRPPAVSDPNAIADQRINQIDGAPNSAKGRRSLLDAALNCGLPQFLVDDVLENVTLDEVKNSGSVKFHTIQLLKLLLRDPGYGMKFQIILDGLPKWERYKNQDHSLFESNPEKNADYMLTNGDGEAMKLLENETQST